MIWRDAAQSLPQFMEVAHLPWRRPPGQV